ncbi:unnamed protein product, partial [Discosporangium mesarthrocarpum]
GKSTLSYLIQHMYEPSKGSVLVDGMDVRVLHPRWLRGQVVVVSQNPAVFAGTVRGNIAYGKPDATLEEVEHAAKVAHAHELIESMPGGFD